MDFTKKRKTEENGDAAESPPQSLSTVAAALTSDDILKILQPFTQDQLLDLLQSASLRHPDVLDSVRTLADRDPALRKLFVRGLSGDTTTDNLRAVFSAYGELDEAIVIMDKNTGKSKGYGFVTFKHVDGAIIALKEPSKKIDGRITVTQLAAASGTAAATDVSARKVFVGNVPFDISSERLLEHFLSFGEIEEGPLGFDKASGKTRGFAFFVYKTEEGARASLAEPAKTIDGHQVICKLAVDNKKAKPGGVPGQTLPSGFAGNGMAFQQQQQQPMQAPMLVSQYGGYVGGGNANNYGVQSSVPSFGNPIPASGGGYGHGVGSAYGNPQFGGPVSSDYGTRFPPNSAGAPSGGFPDGSHYGLPPNSQNPQPMPMPRPPPGGIYQGVPPYY
ncbi:hypothetical protein TanjilG_00168 [Lupinus angustifolius]|uniref:RRM domain-containing protein n=1 Tax=Lupinus angustifolius TaxID=3871 RepID=A0A1J7G9W8_LUPAN|nr:PREDICTED: UBP1-associated protein 2C-like [Lupinus angustifolius]XP_019417331.1 PREDICTED: UBP1-associated protein 2C-like [Lupinus angustifolius]XP_019417332.1 PREDICTED: UBP1-associated protein 2C-like [Lupinus angustifolius]OIV97139.1 hypothetical protein TanjilG_00168 [Lupinus angustifolius]